MNAPRLVVVSLALASLGACASPGSAPKHAPKTESILEVLDRAESAPPQSSPHMTCPAGTVTYCENNVGLTRCGCQDPEEVKRWLKRAFPGN